VAISYRKTLIGTGWAISVLLALMDLERKTGHEHLLTSGCGYSHISDCFACFSYSPLY